MTWRTAATFGSIGEKSVVSVMTTRTAESLQIQRHVELHQDNTGLATVNGK
jgi:hypothetical protein